MHKPGAIVGLFLSDHWSACLKTKPLHLFRSALAAALFFLLAAACSPGNSDRLKIGDRAPDFSITDLNGNHLSATAWQGSPVILRFWDTECKYCRADTPIVNRFFDQYQQRGLKVLYVAMANETIAGVRSFIQDLDIVFPVALDHEGRMAADYQVRMVPQTIFISPDQKIITAILGGVGEAEIEELVGKYLK